MTLRHISRFVLLVSPLAMALASGTHAQEQYPMLDKLAAKVIQKYQSTPCRELIAKKEQPQPPSPRK